MPDLEQDLRATEEDIAADSSRLASIEREKAGLEPDDPRLAKLSAESERLARQIVPKTVAERDIADELAGSATAGTDPARVPTRPAGSPRRVGSSIG